MTDIEDAVVSLKASVARLEAEVVKLKEAVENFSRDYI